jgi:hypothetical protein
MINPEQITKPYMMCSLGGRNPGNCQKKTPKVKEDFVGLNTFRFRNQIRNVFFDIADLDKAQNHDQSGTNH